MTRFTLADVDRAHEAWSCSCGPAALAAICDLTLEEVRPHFERDRAFPGYTNPTLMLAALRSVGRKHHEIGPQPWADKVGRPWPRLGICRVQWGGPWMNPGVPAAARYRATHWIGVSRLQRMDGTEDPNAVCVWDVNQLSNAPVSPSAGWAPLAWWSGVLVPRLTADIKRANGGWSITHSIEVERR